MKKLIILCIFISNIFALEKVSLQLLWLDQFQFAGYYMAKEKGFYKDADLEVDIRKYSNRYSKNVSIVDDVISGKSNYGIGRSNLITEKSKGKDIVALASIFQSSPLILLALESSKINNMDDLKDKRIMLTNSTIGTTSIKAMLVSHGISLNSKNIQPHSFNLNDLINKKTDLMGSYISNEPYVLNQKGIKYKIFSPKNEGYDFYSDILFTSSKEISLHPERADRFLNASLKGWKYAFDNIEETVDLILTKYNSQNKTKDALLFEAKKLKELAYYKNETIGDINIKKLQRIYDIYKIMGKIDNKFDVKELMYSYVKLQLTDEEKSFIKDFHVLKVHNEKSWPPYNYNEYGLPKGYSIDYMNLLANKLGFEVKYVSNFSWDEFLGMIKEKKIDLMLNIVNTESREKYIDFTQPYAESMPSIYVLQERHDIRSLVDLDGKIVSIPKGFYTENILKNYFPKIKLKPVKNILESLEDVAFGRADAAITDLAVADYLLNKHGIVTLKAITHITDERFLSKLNIGVRNDLPILTNILQKGMLDIKDEELFALRNKWFGKKYVPGKKELYFTNQEKTFLQKQREIRICIDPDWAPYEYMKNGEFLGITSDYMKYFSDALNMPIVLVPTNSFNDSLQYIKNKKCDILPAAAITIGRLNYINFTKPYLFSSFVIAVKKERREDINFRDNLDKTYGMVKGYAVIDIFKKKYPNIKIKEYFSINDGLKGVLRNEIHGFIDITSTINSSLNQENRDQMSIIHIPDERLELSIGIRKDAPVLLSIFQKLLTTLSTEEKDAIYRKWITIDYEHITDYSLIWKVFLPLVIIIFYLWNLKLKKEIRQRVLVEKKLKDSVADFTVLVNSTIEAIFIIDKEGMCIEANNEAIKLFGFKHKRDYIGKHIYFIIADEDKEKVKKRIKEEMSFPDKIALIKNDGTIFPGLVKGENIRRVYKTMRIVSIVDLTDLKNKEALLFQQSKMALMGEMMSAIAHQWRQPLNALAVLNMQVETKLEFNDIITQEEYVPISENINNQLEYMSKTIDDFRDFFIPSKEKVLFNTCGVIDDVFDILKPQLLNKNIKFSRNCNELYVSGYVNEFKQVIINIINNARDAIVLNEIENGEIIVDIESSDEKVKIMIKDNGGGIKKDTIDKIFNPYFTTKFKSKGTGIGLYMSKMIIEQSMLGELYVESSGNETIFTIII